MKQIWVVVGESEEYSDYQETNVAAYECEKMAKDHCDAANEQRRRNRGSGGFGSQTNQYDLSKDNPCYYGCENYRVDMIEISESFTR